MQPTGRNSAHRGFSLIEAAVATAIVGIGIVALVAAMEAGTRSNAGGRQLTQAIVLAQNIREWTVRLPFCDPDGGTIIGPEQSSPQVFVDDLDDLMDVVFTPPRDGLGQPIVNMANWSQSIQMTWRDPNSLVTSVSPGTSNIIHVRVEVFCGAKNIYTTGWLVAKRSQS